MLYPLCYAPQAPFEKVKIQTWGSRVCKCKCYLYGLVCPKKVIVFVRTNEHMLDVYLKRKAPLVSIWSVVQRRDIDVGSQLEAEDLRLFLLQTFSWCLLPLGVNKS